MMPVGSPWISVIMPTYNGAEYLTAALDSVRAQGDDGIELVIVDDGSTDDTRDIARSYARHIDVKLICEAHCGNWVAGSNLALRASRGDFVSFLHQDDLWEPGRLAVLRRMVRGNPGASLYLHPAYFIDGEGRRIGLWRCPLGNGRRRTLGSRTVVSRLLVQNFVPMPAALFRRDAAMVVGGMDERLRYAADWDFWLKLASTGPTAYSPTPLSSFRIHGASQTFKISNESPCALRDQLREVLEANWNRYADSLGIHPSRHRVALYSIEVNSRLAAHYHGGPIPWSLAARFLRLGPMGWHIFLSDSRILERIAARLRAGLYRSGPWRTASP
jgi:glycosyltransferase involved in cell wall biosynthesis